MPDSEDGLDGRPEAANLLGIYAALAEQELAQIIGQFAGQQFSALKEALAELAIAKIAPIGDEMRRLNNDPSAVDAVLADGAERARAIAEPVMAEVSLKPLNAGSMRFHHRHGFEDVGVLNHADKSVTMLRRSVE